MTSDFGVQDAGQRPASDELRARMAMSPTGRQIAIDGSFVSSVYDSDPANVMLSPPNGTIVLWEDPDTGVRKIASFLRATGWKYGVQA